MAIVPLLLGFILVMGLAPVPAVHAQVSGPYALWYFLWVTGANTATPQAWPGGSVDVNYGFVNSQSSGSITLTHVGLQTPWGTYYDEETPVTIQPGQEYYNYFNITIPSNEQVGNVSATFAAAASGFGTMTDQYSVLIFANPYTLQSEISSLNTRVTSMENQTTSLQTQLGVAQTTALALQGQVSTLKSELAASQGNSTSLGIQLSSAKLQLSNATGRVSTLTSQLQSAQSQIQSTEGQIGTLSSQLNATRADLAAANGKLAVFQGESSYPSYYLPTAAGIPSALALLFLVMYMRKRSAGEVRLPDPAKAP